MPASMQVSDCPSCPPGPHPSLKVLGIPVVPERTIREFHRLPRVVRITIFVTRDEVAIPRVSGVGLPPPRASPAASSSSPACPRRGKAAE